MCSIEHMPLITQAPKLLIFLARLQCSSVIVHSGKRQIPNLSLARRYEGALVEPVGISIILIDSRKRLYSSRTSGLSTYTRFPYNRRCYRSPRNYAAEFPAGSIPAPSFRQQRKTPNYIAPCRCLIHALQLWPPSGRSYEYNRSRKNGLRRSLDHER